MWLIPSKPSARCEEIETVITLVIDVTILNSRNLFPRKLADSEIPITHNLGGLHSSWRIFSRENYALFSYLLTEIAVSLW